MLHCPRHPMPRCCATRIYIIHFYRRCGNATSLCTYLRFVGLFLSSVCLLLGSCPLFGGSIIRDSTVVDFGFVLLPFGHQGGTRYSNSDRLTASTAGDHMHVLTKERSLKLEFVLSSIIIHTSSHS